MEVLNRAKSIFTNEYFISKSIKFDLGMMYLFVNNKWRECDESTRSLNFEDMIDSEGSKMFASLSKDGKGGDIINIFGKGICYITFDIDGAYATVIDNTNNILDDLFPLSNCIEENDIGRITGIKQ